MHRQEEPMSQVRWLHEPLHHQHGAIRGIRLHPAPSRVRSEGCHRQLVIEGCRVP